MITQYKTALQNILKQTIEDEQNNKVPDGFRKIDYLRNLIDKFCNSSQEAKKSDKRLMLLIDFLEKKGFSCSI